MNARILQDAIVADLTDLFKGRCYATPDGGTAAPAFFAQNLPKRKSEEDDDPFPYVIVRLDSGNIETQTDPHKVAVILLVGAYNDDASNQGHRTVLEIMEVIQQHYEERPLLAGQFVFVDPFSWALQDEESYPYFFGAASLSFTLPAPRREWSDLV
jgi:hypothetical protein